MSRTFLRKSILFQSSRISKCSDCLHDIKHRHLVFEPLENRRLLSFSSLNLSQLNGSNGFMLQEYYESNNSGWSVSTAGDVNGDTNTDWQVRKAMRAKHSIGFLSAYWTRHDRVKAVDSEDSLVAGKSGLFRHWILAPSVGTHE